MESAKQENGENTAVNASEDRRGKDCNKPERQRNPACERNIVAFGKGEPYPKEAAQPTGPNDVGRSRPQSAAAQKKQHARAKRGDTAPDKTAG